MLGALLTAAIFGLDMRQTLSYQLFSLLLALLLVAIVAGQWKNRGLIHVSRRLPSSVMTGQAFHYTLTLHNLTKHRFAELRIWDELQTPDKRDGSWMTYRQWLQQQQQQRGGNTQVYSVTQILAGESHTVVCQFLPLRRGYVYFAASQIGISDPLGLYQKVQHHKNPDKLLVLPKLYQIPDGQLGQQRRYQPGGVAQTVSVAEGASEFVGLRDYRAGDAMRHIHWKSWAKRGKPIIKEYQDEYYTRHGLILDTDIVQGQEAAFEQAVSLAASYAFDLVNQDSLLDLLFVGGQAHHYTGGHGLNSVQPLLEVLACVPPSYTAHFEQLCAQIRHYRPQLSGAVVILLAWDDAHQEFFQALHLPMKIFLISQTPEKYQNLPHDVHLLTTDDLQSQLNG